jgi:hypothetical protein
MTLENSQDALDGYFGLGCTSGRLRGRVYRRSPNHGSSRRTYRFHEVTPSHTAAKTAFLLIVMNGGINIFQPKSYRPEQRDERLVSALERYCASFLGGRVELSKLNPLVFGPSTSSESIPPYL